MDVTEIEKLSRVRGHPAVSILCGLDRRRPGNRRDPRTLDALRRRAVDALSRPGAGRDVERLLARLDAAIATVDLAHPAAGVAILVTADESHVLALPFPVRSRVVVDDTFATRDLLRGVKDALHARVLVLAAERARCLDAVGSSLRERRGSGFPLEVAAPVQEDTPHRDLPIGEHERAEARRFVLRAVDRALDTLQRDERLPLVVVGAERELAYFDEITSHGDDVVGRVHGNHVRDDVETLERVVAPVLDAARERRSAEAVRRAVEAVGSRALAGFAEVAPAARAGRGHELIVEEDLTVGEAIGAGLDDPVDEVVDAVLGHGGLVTTVPPGALGGQGGMVLVLRY